MKRATLAIAMSLVAGLFAPGASQAETTSANCFRDGVTTAGQSCHSEFRLELADGDRFVSAMFTHGDFHAVTLDAGGNAVSGGTGTNGVVTLAWFDGNNGGGWDDVAGAPRGDLIAKYDCQTIAYHSDYQVTENIRGPWCSMVGETKEKFVSGTQVLVVTAKSIANAPATGIRLNGRVAIRQACAEGSNPAPGETCDRF